MPEYSWLARANVLSAKAEKNRVQLYAMDLLWLTVKDRFENLPQPSQIAAGKAQDKRSAKQIYNDTLRKLRGGR